MRATSNPPSLAGIADAVWDEAVNQHQIGGSFGKQLDMTQDRIAVMESDYTRRTPYTYGPTGLGAGVTYVPAAGTVVTVAAMDGIGANEFQVVHGTVIIVRNNGGDMIDGYVGALYCDGTDVGIKNGSAGGLNLVIEGFTI